jgi:hypothetical protein
LLRDQLTDPKAEVVERHSAERRMRVADFVKAGGRIAREHGPEDLLRGGIVLKIQW